MEVKKVFQVSAESTGTFLRQPGLGLYVPAYQRPYSWSNENVDRFIQDLVDGVVRCEENPDAMTFLGALIQVVDPRPASVHPKVQEDLPKGVTLLIDGQQRLTTILIANLCLREEIKRELNGLPKTLPDESRAWFDKKALRMQKDLLGTLYESMPGGDPGFDIYPRMIRAHVDTWSSSSRSATYQSPIARLLHEYAKHATNEDGDRKAYDFTVTREVRNSQREFYGAVARVIRLIRDIGSGVGKRINELEEFCDALGHVKVRSLLLGDGAPPEVKATAALERLLAVGSYLHDRVCVTSVAVTEEDYAFDMFEALNTTGEPLTAYETLRPRIIEAEGLEDYGQSEVKRHLDAIDAVFVAKSQTARRKDTARIVTYFALAESGEKRGRKLSEQRQYLRNSFPGESTAEERIAYVAHLNCLVEFFQELWEPSDQKATAHHPLVRDDASAALAIRALSAAGHEITIAPLTQWFRAWKEEQCSETAREFGKVAKGLAAFFAVWRLTHAGTANVDGIVRKLMREGNQAPPMAALARRRGNGPLPSATVFVGVLRSILGGVGIMDGESFAVRMKQAPAYQRAQAHTRLILLMASHDAVADASEPGLLKAGTPGVCPMLTLDRWEQTAETIEHIAPQVSGSSWDPELYRTEGAIHRLGNLTILPLGLNAALGNRDWESKKYIYGLLSARSHGDAEKLREVARAQGIRVPERWEAQHPYQVQVESLGEVGEWSMSLVDRRSEMLALLAWRMLDRWLEG